MNLTKPLHTASWSFFDLAAPLVNATVPAPAVAEADTSQLKLERTTKVLPPAGRPFLFGSGLMWIDDG